MNSPRTVLVVWFSLLSIYALNPLREGRAAGVPDLVSNIGSLSAAERHFLSWQSCVDEVNRMVVTYGAQVNL